MTYAEAHAWEAEAARLGVSNVARSRDGFMREYEEAGTASAMNTRPLPRNVHGGVNWGEKRSNFVRRFIAQYKKNPTYGRYLALIMWAYMPPGQPPVIGSKRSAKVRTRKSKISVRHRGALSRRKR